MATEAVIGVVLEIGMARGVDLLAAYADRSARYQSFSGATSDWQRPDESLDAPIADLLAAATAAVDDTGLIDPRECSALRFGEARVVLLLPDLIRGVQGSILALSANPRIGHVLRQASVVTRALVANAGAPGRI